MAKRRDTRGEMYASIIVELFRRHCPEGCEQFDFEREEIREIANALCIQVPQNLGDFVYSYKFRRPLPAGVVKGLPEGKTWILKNVGRSLYRFELGPLNRIIPRMNMAGIKIPDNTPEIIRMHAKGDEQAILARVRYNRLIDIFLGLTTYSLQNHMRTSVKGIGQIEVDELYVGVNREGTQFIVPVQAKVKDDQHSVVQTMQDLALCREKFPTLICRAVSAQFLEHSETIVMFELVERDGEILVQDEKHYNLVSAREISSGELAQYRASSYG